MMRCLPSYMLAGLLLATPQAGADRITLKTGFVIEGKLLDAEADPVILQLPKGKIEVFQDMIESVEIIEEGEMEEAGEVGLYHDLDEDEEIPVEPLIQLRPSLQTEDDVLRHFNNVSAELERILTRPEETAPGEETLEAVYAQALGEIGPRAAPLLLQSLETGSPLMAATLLDALAVASPDDAQAAAKQVLSTHEHPRARERAVSLVASAPRDEATLLLDQARKDNVWYVRSAAYREIAKSDNEDALSVVAEGLADSDDDVKQEVRQMLQEKTGVDFETTEDWNTWQAAQKKAPVTAN